MSRNPAFLFYPNDYLGGTMGMTFEQKGAYIELLILQFNRGHMTSHMIGHTVGQLWDDIKEKFKQDENGLWYNERLDIEKNKRQSYSESRKNNKKGVNQYTYDQKTDGHMIGHMTNNKENENENDNKEIGKGVGKGRDAPEIPFEKFWDLYGKKVGDKPKCEKKWLKLKPEERKRIMQVLPAWLSQFQDKQYQPYPATFLNQKRWNDEIQTKRNGYERNAKPPEPEGIPEGYTGYEDLEI